MLKKSFSLIVAAVCVSFLFGGCSKQTTYNTERQSVTILDAQRDYSGLIELVKEKYPEIIIEVEPYRGRNMSAYCKWQLETGSMPDIYSTTQAWNYPELQKENLVDLSKYHVSELYNNARLNEYYVDGGLYYLPFDYSITGITYNATLFEENGITVPTSFDQLKNETIPTLKSKGIKVTDTLLNLPGSAFNYFFSVNSGYMNTLEGRQWRSNFVDIESDVFASNDPKIQACVDYFQEWIDCGMISFEEGLSDDESALLADFYEGNTAFLLGTVRRFSQNDDGTGDQYSIMPYLSQDGTENCYIVSPTRFYGLNKDLEKPENKQKLEDALHILEVLSTNKGYAAVNSNVSTNMCSIDDFVISESSPYKEAIKDISKGKYMNSVYTGWNDMGYVASFGNSLLSALKGEQTLTDSIEELDGLKRSVKATGVTYYAEVTEELSTIQAAQLTGQMFMDATDATVALISYNIYNPNIHALMENSYGANGKILKGKLTEEYITVFLPTGWYEHIMKAEYMGSKIKEMAKQGCDTRATGFHYPYVLMTADGEPLEDDKTYTVVLCGYNKSEKSQLNLIDTGIVGLDAAKEYLQKVKTVSSATLDDSLVQYITEIKTEEVAK